MPTTIHQRRPSRSNSISSSVASVKKSASLSKPNPRASVLKSLAVSPGDAVSGQDFLIPRTTSRSRRGSVDDKSVHNRNINRWSHSTSSSTSGIDTEAVRKRLQDSSRRMSAGPGFSGHGNSAAPSPDRIRHSSRQRSDGRGESVPVAQNLSAGPRHTQQNRSPNASASSLTPTSMFNTNSGDYFGETWHHRKQSNKLGEPLASMSIAYTTTTAANQKARRVEAPTQLKLTLPQPASPSHVAMQERPPRADNTVMTNSQNPSSAQSPEHRKGRGHRSPIQKTILSRALAKAKTAVLLDNAQNIEGAIEAYAEACDLLQQVMGRSSDADDRKKLSAIQSTYSSRIAELHDLDDSFAGLMDKALPDDPPPDDPNNSFFGSPIEQSAAEVLEQVHIPPRQESLLPQIFGGERYLEDPIAPARRPVGHSATLTVPMEAKYMPPPLSPRRPPSPSSAETVVPSTSQTAPKTTRPPQHARRGSSESTSWLDTVDDVASSHSSRLSSLHLDKTKTSILVDEIEAEFDAALNAAIDTAYDDDPELEDTPRQDEKYSKGILPSLPHAQPSPIDHARGRTDLDTVRTDYLDEDTTEEEERLLDEMTQGFVFDDFHFDSKSKSALPRESDSSSFSNRTFSSSVPSTTLTNGTTLSTLAENRELPQSHPKEVPHPPPPSQEDSRPLKALSPPTSPPKAEHRFSGINGVNLRERRLSGQSARQLKIETFAPTRGTSQPPSKNTAILPKIDIPPIGEQRISHTAPLPAVHGPTSTSTQATQPITPITSVHSGDSAASESPATPAMTQGGSQGSLDEATGAPSSPLRSSKAMPPPPAPIRKNLSSSSLRMRNLSVHTNDDSPLTPNSAIFPTDSQKGVPPLPTPTHPAFMHQTSYSGGMHLFDDHIGTPASPRTPRTPSVAAPSHAPLALEPCPESFLLRPWWLMRCLYQTIAHPRGGHLSTKLFMPRDIWRVKSVKLKLLDDKVSQCDVLTAALLKLAKVDHLDADAVWDELQSFETVLDQVRGVLQKKLGSDVGLSSSANVFKSPNDDAEPLSAKSNNSSAAKSIASSWRKLRSKSSSAAITNSSTTSGSKDASATHTNAGLTMSSLPMTSSSNVPTSRSYHTRHRPAPPTPTQLTNIPIHHATYMASLARLFDAAQILDSIARQVVDPGLKCSSETLVGLELSVRHAAEFFAFYVIRFVMADMGILVDKFLKRGTEWVLA